MTSLINASTSAGVVITPDTSGVLALQTAGTTAVTVDASQNVGIGTASPGAKLDVSNGAVRLSTSYQVQWFNGATQLASILADSGPNLTFQTGSSNTERMRIDSVGNVGIGTNTPITRLHASGTDTEVVALRLQNTTASTGKTWQVSSNNAGQLNLATIPGVADYITVSSSGVTAFSNVIAANGTISTSTTSWSATSGGAAYSFNNVGLYLIYGQNAAFSIFWRDLVLCNIYGGATVIASNGYTGGGALPTRTYSSSPYLSVSLTGTAGTYTGTWLLLN